MNKILLIENKVFSKYTGEAILASRNCNSLNNFGKVTYFLNSICL